MTPQLGVFRLFRSNTFKLYCIPKEGVIVNLKRIREIVLVHLFELWCEEKYAK